MHRVAQDGKHLRFFLFLGMSALAAWLSVFAWILLSPRLFPHDLDLGEAPSYEPEICGPLALADDFKNADEAQTVRVQETFPTFVRSFFEAPLPGFSRTQIRMHPRTGPPALLC